MLANLDQDRGARRRRSATRSRRATRRASARSCTSTGWRKRERSPGMSNADIDRWYEVGIDNGAIGGKLVGAGAGGFLLFYAEDPAPAPRGDGRGGPDRGPVRLRPRRRRGRSRAADRRAVPRARRRPRHPDAPADRPMPKALLPVAGRPFADHQLELAGRGRASSGVVYCDRPPRRHDPGPRSATVGRSASRRLRRRGRRAAGAPAAPSAWRSTSALLGRRSSSSTATPTSRSTYGAVWAAPRRPGRPALMTVLPQRRPVATRATSASTSGRLVRYDKGAAGRWRPA